MKRILALLLAFSQLAVLPAVTMVVAEDVSESVLPLDEETMPWETNSDNAYNKIHFYVGSDAYSTIDNAEELSEAVDAVNSLKNEMSISFCSRTVGTGEPMQLYVQFKSDIRNDPTYIALLEKRKVIDTIEESNEWRSRLNSFSKEYHDNLVTECIDSIESIDLNEYTHVDYSPFVFINTTSDAIDNLYISQLAFNACTENIIIDKQSEYATEFDWDNTLKCINATSIGNTSKYTGKGVNIGVLEAEGICDVNNSFLKTKNITVNTSKNISDHATEVVSVLATLAPEANYFVDASKGGGALPFTWFLENNCQVINMSFGVIHPKISIQEYVYDENGEVVGIDTTYENQDFQYMLHVDGLVDYMIYNHEISVVVSSGNLVTDNKVGNYNPDGEITSPGYAYNAITVGGVYYNTIAECAVHAKTACYVSDEGIMKPNISAVSNGVILPSDETNTLYGTSYAAPQVTAAIALLIQKNLHTEYLLPDRFPCSWHPHKSVPVMIMIQTLTGILMRKPERVC